MCAGHVRQILNYLLRILCLAGARFASAQLLVVSGSEEVIRIPFYDAYLNAPYL